MKSLWLVSEYTQADSHKASRSSNNAVKKENFAQAASIIGSIFKTRET